MFPKQRSVVVTGLASIPRAPKGLPLLGHVLPLWRRPLDFVDSLRDTGDLVRVDLGPLPVYFVNSSSLAKEVMVTKGPSFEKGRLFDRMRPLVGNGLANSSGETHRKHRRLMQPSFHHARIAGYATAMSREAQAAVDTWKPGQTIAVERAMAELVINTLAATMFSADLGRPAVGAVHKNVPVILKTMLMRAVSPKLLDHLPIPPNRRFDAATAELLKVIDDVIALTRESGDADQPDLLSTLLATRDAETGESLSDAEIRDQLMTILFAGSETTASTLSWAMYEIARHPEVESRILAEIDAVVGDDEVGLAHVPQLEYTQRVMDEVLRLHSVTLLMRRATEPVDIGGVTIPTGTEIAFSLYALHRDPRVYTDPKMFDPDRWEPERRRHLPREAYVPFGSGTRKCIGDAFASTQITITLATILPRWRLQLVPGRAPHPATAAMPYPDHLPMRVSPRQATARRTAA
ncbi:cytochrome P450 [Actinacidiphila glaucinigra]|uniref:cytochrome P450 n=1 Tax=Actinacidiphila glaucinigra TaxID=235986 RepID=UPI0037C79103